MVKEFFPDGMLARAGLQCVYRAASRPKRVRPESGEHPETILGSPTVNFKRIPFTAQGPFGKKPLSPRKQPS